MKSESVRGGARWIALMGDTGQRLHDDPASADAARVQPVAVRRDPSPALPAKP